MNPQRRFWLIILMLTLPALLGALAMDMLLPALPDMAVSLQLSAGQMQWMLNIFILGFALCQLLVGLGATRFSDHHLFLLAIVLFILSSAGIALITSYTGILVFPDFKTCIFKLIAYKLYDRFTDPYDLMNFFPGEWNPNGTPFDITGQWTENVNFSVSKYVYESKIKPNN
ncbi:hypothetical protein [Xenorhabdus sp. SGI246]|uniref:hypothetical protein n=1 Tax=Xenorhabdus sp. SGI246 TaxID=3158263 RepID=UPI00349FA125